MIIYRGYVEPIQFAGRRPAELDVPKADAHTCYRFAGCRTSTIVLIYDTTKEANCTRTNHVGCGANQVQEPPGEGFTHFRSESLGRLRVVIRCTAGAWAALRTSFGNRHTYLTHESSLKLGGLSGAKSDRRQHCYHELHWMH